MKIRFLSLVVAVCAVINGYGQNGVTYVVPSGASNTDGNTDSVAGPAVNQPQTIRYQQIYAASEFASLTNSGGGWVGSLHFRGDATNGAQLGIKMPSVQVNLSTTQRRPDELSSAFSANVGSDDTLVYSDSLETVLIGGHRQGPESFSFEIFPLAKLFFYNPAAGNLLLDVRIFQGNTNTIGGIPIIFDAVNVTNDSVSRVWWGDVNASTGMVESIGLPTELTFWRNPKLTVQLRTNSVELTWPANPPLSTLPNTVLESRQGLGSQAQWQAITSGIVTTMSNFTHRYMVPLNSAGPAGYFRLVSTTPP